MASPENNPHDCDHKLIHRNTDAIIDLSNLLLLLIKPYSCKPNPTLSPQQISHVTLLPHHSSQKTPPASMAFPLLHTLLPLCLILLALTRASGGDVAVADATNQLPLHLGTSEMAMEMSIYDDFDEFEGEGDENVSISGRRSLFWRSMRYYISYGALSANRVPCPPRSGRSYYTHNCWRAKGPVRPYTRGCSTITRCRR